MRAGLLKFMLSAVIASTSVLPIIPVLAGELTVTVTNIKSSEGKIRVAVTTEENFLQNTNLTAATEKQASESEGGKLSVTFDEIANGEYAVQVLHDENENGKMDRNMMRMPKEPFGFSNDAPIRMGPPKWDDAKIEVTDKPLAIDITLR